MFKKLLQLKTLLVALLVMTGAGNVWADEVTYTFTTKGWGATPANWTSGKDGGQLTKGQGIQVTTGASGANGTSPVSYSNISQIVVKYCTNAEKGAGTIKVKVGDGTEKSFTVSKPSSGGTTLKDATFNFSPVETGKVKVTVNCTANSVYIYSVKITYSSGSTTETCAAPTFSPAAGTYTSAQDVTISTETTEATIYYTTDGTDPTQSSSVYSTPISVSANTTIKAMAAKDGMTNSNVATATYVITDNAAPSPSWEATSLEDLTEDDVFVIVGNNSYNYAMTNDNGTSSAPSAKIVNIEDGKIAGTVADNLKWNIAGDATNGYTFYPAGSTETWLYCTNTNNGVRVGTGEAKHFTLSKNGYLTTTETKEQRYLGIYNHADWRCYTSEGGNIADQTFTFFRLVDSTLPRLTVSDVNLDYNAESGSIDYKLTNPVTGGVLKATSSEDWLKIEEPTLSLSTIPFSCSENPTVESRTATVTLTYSYDTDKSITKTVTVTQKGYVPDYATLPFVWEGGASSVLTDLNGVTASGLGNDYAVSNAPYNVKLDDTDDYIQVKTDSQPGKVTIGVKMIGGSNTSTITVQESADGETFKEVESLSISGNQNAELTLETTEEFASPSRYVRLLFTKGSNVGVGPITIVGCSPLSVSEAGYATFSSMSALDFTNVKNIHAYTATVSGDTISFTRVNKVPANTGLLLRSVKGGAVSTSVPSLTDDAEDVRDNAFVAATEDIDHLATTDGDYTNYILNNGSSGIGFYKANGQKVGAGKAYLRVSSSSKLDTRAFIAFSFDDPETGIAQVETLPQQGVAYDLQGRRVNAPKGGLYIINGKKVIVK